MRATPGDAVTTEQTAQSQTEKRLADIELEVKYLVDQTPACKVRRFGNMLVESCRNGSCDPESFRQAMQGLIELREAYVVAYLRSNRGAEDLNGERLEEIRHMLADRSRRPTSRLLVVALPSGEPRADWERASQVAQDLLTRIHDRVSGSHAFAVIKPTAIGCSRDTRSLFTQFAAKKPPHPPKEPKVGQAIIAVIFRLDCY